MNSVSVKASQSYEVIIGSHLLPNIGAYVSKIQKNCRAAVISDTNVWPHYGHIVIDSLITTGFTPVFYVFPAGEASKNASTYLDILNFLAENRITRSDLIIALGGGVVGDITGFSAATFLRGVPYVQIPTSLLAMVDSSVGGKTAIDLPAGKNLVGAFNQPKLVLCDTDVLNTLPKEWFLDGSAEVIKYGMLYDQDLIRSLLETGPDFNLEDVITKCVSFKRDVVEEDEFDTGARQKLNLGHTIGHAIEANSHFTITHGQAVAAGMAILTKAAAVNGLCTKETYDTLISLLSQFSLPVSTTFTATELCASALSDKKRTGDNVNLIVPRQIGCCGIFSTPVSELESFIKAGL